MTPWSGELHTRRVLKALSTILLNMKPKIVTAQVLSNRINNCDDRPGVVAESRLEIKIENNNGFRVCYYLALFLKWKWDSVVEIL